MLSFSLNLQNVYICRIYYPAPPAKAKHSSLEDAISRGVREAPKWLSRQKDLDGAIRGSSSEDRALRDALVDEYQQGSKLFFLMHFSICSMRTYPPSFFFFIVAIICYNA